MTYSEKLKDPRWQKKRLEVMERDGWACRDCGSNQETLNVHHCYYLSNTEPWDYPDNSLRTLCDSCHKTRHEIADTLCNRIRCGNINSIMKLNQLISILANTPDFPAQNCLNVFIEMVNIINESHGR